MSFTSDSLDVASFEQQWFQQQEDKQLYLALTAADHPFNRLIRESDLIESKEDFVKTFEDHPSFEKICSLLDLDLISFKSKPLTTKYLQECDMEMYLSNQKAVEEKKKRDRLKKKAELELNSHISKGKLPPTYGTCNLEPMSTESLSKDQTEKLRSLGNRAKVGFGNSS